MGGGQVGGRERGGREGWGELDHLCTVNVVNKILLDEYGEQLLHQGPGSGVPKRRITLEGCGCTRELPLVSPNIPHHTIP